MPEEPESFLTFRRRYAELLRHFIAGRITNDEFLMQAGDLRGEFGDSPTVSAVHSCAFCLCDHMREYRLTGKDRLQQPWRRRAARWIVFLRSGAPLAEVRGTKLTFRRCWRYLLLEAAVGAGMLLAVALGAIGATTGDYVMVASACIGVIGMVFWSALLWCLGPRSKESCHRVRAFLEDESDPWPFQSRADLDAALARPTYLHG